MKIIKKLQCSGIWEEGPFKGQRCSETAPSHLVHCSSTLTNGCDNYYCLMFHWHDHWSVHDDN